MLRCIRTLTTKGKPFVFPEIPRPIPLSNPKDQKEFEDSIAEKAINPDAPLVHGEPYSSDYVNKNNGEIGGPKGKEPTRFGDWERKGRISDF